MIEIERLVYKPASYNCEVSELHIPTVTLPTDRNQIRYAQREWEYYHKDGRLTDYTESLEGLHNWGDKYARMLPAGLDMARDVDGGGEISHVYEPKMFTSWVETDPEGAYLRFSQARTASYGRIALRTPVMSGIAIESTAKPDSKDIRDAHTMFIIGKARTADDIRGQSWLKPRPAQLFDMSEFSEKPYFIGPLYNGHPNRIDSEERQQQVVRLGMAMLSELRSS